MPEVDASGGSVRRVDAPSGSVRRVDAPSGSVRRVDAGEADSLAEGAARSVVVDGRPIAIWRIDGRLFAYGGACLHRGGPLAEGLVRDGIVTCPWHWWRYDLRTGSLVGVAGVRLPSYPVGEVEGRIVVEVPAPAPSSTAGGSIRERLLARARAAVGVEGESGRAPEQAGGSGDPGPNAGPPAPSPAQEVRS
jgi:nitrite reductase/ring-hydroxylating ferredoxin subunit